VRRGTRRLLALAVVLTIAAIANPRAACPGNWSCSQLDPFHCFEICVYCGDEEFVGYCYDWNCWFGLVYAVHVKDYVPSCTVCGSVHGHDCWWFPE
jgi:hypothetical protein